MVHDSSCQCVDKCVHGSLKERTNTKLTNDYPENVNNPPCGLNHCTLLRSRVCPGWGETKRARPSEIEVQLEEVLMNGSVCGSVYQGKTFPS